MSAHLIALDWGTSNLRASLLGDDGAVIDTRSAASGVMAVRERRFADALTSLCGPWLAAHPHCECIASGMIGSRQGWVEAPYIDCPAGLSDAAARLTPMAFGEGHTLHIVPGLRCVGASGQADVMRGEETQLLGSVPADAPRTLVVLPGTHSKWARVEHGVVLDFTTFMTGEMYDALLGHTILGRLPADAPAVNGPAAFERGVLRGLGAGGFTHDVFGARTLMLMGELPAGDVPEWLSGFVIGREIRNARTWAQHAGDDASRVLVVGSDALASRYLTALRVSEIAATPGPVDAAAAGIYRIALAAGKLGHA